MELLDEAIVNLVNSLENIGFGEYKDEEIINISNIVDERGQEILDLVSDLLIKKS